MFSCYFELKVAPDFSLAKYATLSESGPQGVLSQHRAFWRQINRWGKMFTGSIHMLYYYLPNESSGYRLSMILRFDSPSSDGIDSIRRIMKASIISPYYDQLRETDSEIYTDKKYAWRVNLMKKEYFISPSSDSQSKLYITSEWKMNESARLYSMYRIMEALEEEAVYCVDIYPIDYSEKFVSSISNVMLRLKDMTSFKVKSDAGSISGGKDENAKKVLKYYEDIDEDIKASPHFLVNIQAFSMSENAGKQILDAAASEALDEGDHLLYSEVFGGTVKDATDQFMCWSDPSAPNNISYLPHLMTLEQVTPFALFPVLFPGEAIQMPKETIPVKQEGMLLGKDTNGHDIFYPWTQLKKHVFMAGMPGSGKTNTMMYCISEMHKAGIPFLILEPAKKEYRSMSTLDGMEDVSLFSPCANSMFPIHINPFEFPVGMKLSDHINRLLDVFNGTFQLDPPFPLLLTEGIQNCYEELKWLPGMINTGKLKYPTMKKLYGHIEKLFDKYQYDSDVRKNLQSVLQVRIGSLMAREMGDIFDVEKSTLAPNEWMKRNIIIELASLGTAPSNFMMLLLMTLIRETLSIETYDPVEFNNKPRHVIFIEEAHNLIADTSVQPAGGMDPKIAATAYVMAMLAEVRALGEGIVIADQLPTAMAPEVVKNTSLKIGLRLTSQDERQMLGSSMSADGVQMERMGIFTPGNCLVGYEGLLKPFELQIPMFKGDSALRDDELLFKSVGKVRYWEDLAASARIFRNKYVVQMQLLIQNNFVYENSIAKATESDEDAKLAVDKFSDIMSKWCRLTLDVLLYYSTSFTRKMAIEQRIQSGDEINPMVNKISSDWDNEIRSLYKNIQKKRDELKEIARSSPFNIDTDMYDKSLHDMQKIIAEATQVTF